MKIYSVKYILVFIFFSLPAYTQVYKVSVDSVVSSNYITTNYENNINAASLISKVNLEYNTSKIRFLLYNNFASDVSKLTQNFIRDFNNLKFITDYKLSKNIFTGAGVENVSLSDERSVEINKNKNSFYFAHLEYLPFQNLTLNSRLGYKTEDQIGVYSTGYEGTLNGEANELNLQNYITNAKLNVYYENLDVKTNYNYELAADVFKTFTIKADNKSIMRVYSTRSDFYLPASQSIINTYGVMNNIQSRVDNYAYLEDNLRYYFRKNLSVGVSGNFTSRGIDKEYRYTPPSSTAAFENIYDSKILENRLEVGANAEYTGRKFFTKLRAGYYERSENHSLSNGSQFSSQQASEYERIEKDKNNNSAVSFMYLESIFAMSNKNSFKLSSSSSILRYDTDSKDNYDDRDEINIIGQISHIYTDLKNFILETTFEINRSHLAYLYKERSSNNNVNKIYKLTSRSVYSPFENLLTVNTFQVLANYTVYDFQDLVSQVQSFSFRQLSLKDSVFYNIKNKVFFDFYGDIKFYEQGEFNDKNFSVRPLTYFDERRYYIQAGYMIGEYLRISAGYNYFIQKRYEYDKGNKNLKHTIEHYGPVGKLSMLLKKNTSINIQAGKDYFRADDDPQGNSSESLQIYVIWNI